MTETPSPDEQARYARARRRVNELRGFYIHATVFVGVNALLHVINFTASSGYYWAFWPLLGWGMGLGAHAAATYRWLPVSSQEWKERKIKELINKERDRDAPR